MVQINGQALVALAHQNHVTYRLEDLVQCLGDPEEVIQKLRIAKLMFKGEKGRLLAIVKIQAFARSWKA